MSRTNYKCVHFSRKFWWKKKTKHKKIDYNIKTGGTEFERNCAGWIQPTHSASFVVALCGWFVTKHPNPRNNTGKRRCQLPCSKSLKLDVDSTGLVNTIIHI
jgi:hypothetical protein